MRKKRLPFNDTEALDEEEEPTKRQRTQFVELQPSQEDPADAIDEEVPGSVPAGVDPLVLADRPFHPYSPGDPQLSSSHAAGDPGFARAQRALLRRRREDNSTLGQALQAQEQYDQPEEVVNERGVPMEPFHLRRELSEGFFDPSGNYIAYDQSEEKDAWLESLDDRVQGTSEGTAERLPYPNEPVAEPPPLPPRQLLTYGERLVGLLQPGETVPQALRRLAGGGPVLDKFGSREEARAFFTDRVRSGHAVPPGNYSEFRELTEAAEVLLDGGFTWVYSASRAELDGGMLGRLQESKRRPEPAACQAGQRDQGAEAGGQAAGAGRRRHHDPPEAAPAAAAEPPVAPGQPSVPSGERTAAATRRGEGVGAAALGFAAELPKDVLEEQPPAVLPSLVMEAGLGAHGEAPTAVELRQQQGASGEGGPPGQQHGLPGDLPLPASQPACAALEAALHGTFGGGEASVGAHAEPATRHLRGSNSRLAGGTSARTFSLAAGQQGRPDEKLEAEFQRAARRHHDVVQLPLPEHGGRGVPDLAPAAGGDFRERQQQAEDQPSTEVLPGAGGGGGERPAHSQAANQGDSAPGWQELLHPTSLPGEVAGLVEDPLAYPSPSQPSEASQGPGLHKGNHKGKGTGNIGGVLPKRAAAAASATGHVALMGVMEQPGVGASAAGAALAGRLESVERLLEEQEEQAMHRGQGARTTKQAIAFDNEAANLAAAHGADAAPAEE